MTNQIPHNRHAALDVLRGIAVAAMIIVLNLGYREHVFAFLQLSAWNGCTLADLIFPAFLFVAGVSLFFSFKHHQSTLDKDSLTKIGKRTLYLFLLGVALNAFPFFTINWSELRLFGTLQRFALAYGIASCLALWLKSPQKIALAAVLLIGLHWAIFALFGDYSIENNIAGKIDAFLVGERHLQANLLAPFDPDGLLGAIPGAASILFGYIVGCLIHSIKNQKICMQRLLGMGAIALAAGLLWSDNLPINKPLWTGSFVMLSTGWVCMAFVGCVYLSEIKVIQKWLMLFRALGMNALVMYIMTMVLTYTFQHVRTLSGQTIRAWLYAHIYIPIFGDNAWASLVYALMLLIFSSLFAILLYRQKVFIKL